MCPCRGPTGSLFVSLPSSFLMGPFRCVAGFLCVHFVAEFVPCMSVSLSNWFLVWPFRCLAGSLVSVSLPSWVRMCPFRCRVGSL